MADTHDDTLDNLPVTSGIASPPPMVPPNTTPEPDHQSLEEKENTETKSEPESPQQQPTTEIRLVDVPINNKHDAFQLLIHFLNLANKRGSFGMEESHKIWDCIKMFSS